MARIIHVAEDQPWGAWDHGDPWGAPPALPGYGAPFERLALAFTLLFTTKGIPLVYYGDEVGLAGAGDPDNRRPMQFEGLSDHQLALRSHLEKLGAIRHDHPALWRGGRQSLDVTDDTYVYEMLAEDDRVVVVLNRADVSHQVDGLALMGRDLLTDATVTGPSFDVPPRSSMIVVPE